MTESVLAKRFGHRATQEPVVELAPKPTVQAALASIAAARNKIDQLRTPEGNQPSKAERFDAFIADEAGVLATLEEQRRETVAYPELRRCFARDRERWERDTARAVTREKYLAQLDADIERAEAQRGTRA
jgi:hypothetical protein